MKLLLDEHLSWRYIGTILVNDEHNVRSVNGESALKAMGDPELFELAIREARILITANHKDFDPIARNRNLAGASHSGMILVPGNVRNDNYGRLLGGIRVLLADILPSDWTNRVVWLPPKQ